jgi:hypothetical protein
MDRLRALQHPAVDRIAKLIDQDQFPTVAYAASKDVLDRTLGRATETLDVKHSVDASSISDDDLRVRIRALLNEPD